MHTCLRQISRKSGIRVRNPFGNAINRLLWLGITSNHIFGALDAILKKCWGLLKTKYDEKREILGILAPQVCVNTTQFQDSIVTVHQKGGGGVTILLTIFLYVFW